MVRNVTLGFALVFAVVVAMGYVPSFISPGAAGERLMFGLFQISLIDDITHGVTALAALAAGFSSRRASLLFLTAFGFYYALDAAFYLTYGFFNDKPWIADLALNLPHVGIATLMLGTVYWWVPRFDRARTASTPAS